MLSSSLISPSLGGSRKNISRSKKIKPNLPLNLDEIDNIFFKDPSGLFFFDLEKIVSNPPLLSYGGFSGTQHATFFKFLDQALVALLLAEFDHIIDVRPWLKGLVLGTFQTDTAPAHTHTCTCMNRFLIETYIDQ